MKNKFIIGLVDRLGTQQLIKENEKKAKQEINRFTELCEKWAKEGSSTNPDNAQLFSDSLIVKWDNPKTPLIVLLELATLFIFAHKCNVQAPGNPLWIRGAIIQGDEKITSFGHSKKPIKYLRNYALTGLKLSMAEKMMPGNRLYLDSSLINGRPEMEKMGIENLCVIPWPKPYKSFVDIFWCNVSGIDILDEILPMWINTCEKLFNENINSNASTHALNTLSMLTYAAFQFAYFKTENYLYNNYKYILRYIVWTAKCASVVYNSISANKFLDICKSIPSKLTATISDLFETSGRVQLASDIMWRWKEPKEALKFDLPWEKAIKAIEC